MRHPANLSLANRLEREKRYSFFTGEPKSKVFFLFYNEYISIYSRKHFVSIYRCYDASLQKRIWRKETYHDKMESLFLLWFWTL